MKRILLFLSFMAMVAFVAAPAWAGPSSLSDNEMDSVYAKGLDVCNGGFANCLGGTGAESGVGIGRSAAANDHSSAARAAADSAVASGNSSAARNSGSDSAVANDRSAAARQNSAVANDHSTALRAGDNSAVAQGWSNAANVREPHDSAVAQFRSSAVLIRDSNNAVQVRVSGDNAFNSLQNQTYVNSPINNSNGGQTVSNNATALAVNLGDANATASAIAVAVANNQNQNNLNKSVQVRGNAQNQNAGNSLIGVQSVVAQQVNATVTSSSMAYGGQTLQGNAIAVNAFHN